MRQDVGRGRGGDQAPQNTPAGGSPAGNTPTTAVTYLEDLPWLDAVVPKGCSRYTDLRCNPIDDAKVTFWFYDPQPEIVVTGEDVHNFQIQLGRRLTARTPVAVKVYQNKIVDIRNRELRPEETRLEDESPREGGERSGR